jgi:hypothetical protein
VESARASRHKLRTRERLRDAGLPVPWFTSFPVGAADRPSVTLDGLPFPCVVKPVALSGSRGVMRADDPESFLHAVGRLRRLLRAPDIRAEQNDAHDLVLVEGFIPGREYAVEVVMHHGELHPIAVFEKPDPLDGPFFEETIYVTPPRLSVDQESAIMAAVARAAAAIGLYHGPVHAECRVNGSGVFVLEAAARPIGGLCARAIHLHARRRSQPAAVPFEEMLLEHALGESPAAWRREDRASGVMMIPIPRRGVFRGADGIDHARGLPHVEDVRITAKPDQVLVPLPEGSSYLGFIFARADDARDVERALRAAHRCLRFAIDPEFRVRQSA